MSARRPPPPPPPQLSLEALTATAARVPAGLWTALSHREQLFVAHLLIDPKMEHRAAAEAAGAPTKSSMQSGSRMAARPHVRAALECALAERIARTLVDADFIVTEAVEVLRGAKGDKEWGAANGSLTLLARIQGLLNDKLRVDFRDVSQLSDAELEAEAQAMGLEK